MGVSRALMDHACAVMGRACFDQTCGYPKGPHELGWVWVAQLLFAHAYADEGFAHVYADEGLALCTRVC